MGPAPEPLPRLTTRPDVQGLRAVAVALVILDHAGVSWLRGGFIGVDVFFVVSGFLISSLLLHEATSTGRVRIAFFYGRRARRILPAATVVLVATSVFAAVELSMTRVTQIVDDVRWAAFFAANVHFAQLGTDYFEQDRALSPVQHYWSLAVEEQFYLVWPVLLSLVVVLASRRKVEVVAALVAAAWVASLIWSLVLTPRSPTESYFSSGTRAWELATGALLAMGGNLLPYVPRMGRQVLAGVGLVAVLVAAISYDSTTPFPGWRALLPVLGTAAILAAGSRGAVGAARVLTLPPLQYLGNISYSLYLWHWPVLVLGVVYVGASRSRAETLKLLAAILVLSVISYHAVENPLRRSRGPVLRGRRALALWPVALTAVLVGCAWSGAHATSAFEARVAGQQTHVDAPMPTPGSGSVRRRPRPIRQRLAGALHLVDSKSPIPFPLVNLDGLHEDVWQFRFKCYSSWDDVEHDVCPTGESHAPTVVVYGDSHAGMWVPALKRLSRRDDYRLVPFVKVGCAPFDVEQTHRGAAYPECPAFRRWAMRRIAALHPDVVLLAYRGLFAVQPASGQSVETAWTNGVSSVVRRLLRVTPEVKVISDITSLQFSPADCITEPDSTMSSCLTREAEVTRRGNTLTRRTVEPLGARFVDVTDLVCLRRRCPLVVDQVVTYRDDSHISVTWSDIITDEFGRRIALSLP
jgi:peptidoglycan/LPS O-acetylase OafA/YrhL